MSKQNPPRHIFFGIMYVEPSNEELIHHFAETHKYSTIPWLAVSPESDKRDHTSEHFFSPESEWNFLQNDNVLGIKQIEFVNKHTGHDVKLTLTFKQTILANALIVGILAGGLIFIYVCYPMLVTQEMWLYIACCIYIICVGGVIYVRMDDPQPYGFEI